VFDLIDLRRSESICNWLITFQFDGVFRVISYL